MVKVLIVDDEKLVRQMIMLCINWTEIGMEIVGDASNATQAMELVKEKKPDLVLTDIRMPVVGGLEFARNVREQFPKIKVVFLSGHDEFEYASEGIKMGAFDYLLKPINQEELRNAMVKVRDAILSEQADDYEILRLKEKLRENKNLIIAQLLIRFLQDSDYEETKENLEYLGFHMQEDMFQIAIVDFKPGKAGGETLNEEKKLLQEIWCRELTQQFFENHENIYVLENHQGGIIIFNNSEDTDFGKCCEGLKDYLLEHIQGTLCIGVGRKYKSSEDIRLSYGEAAETLKYQFIEGPDQVLSFRDISSQFGTTLNFEEKDVHELGILLRTGQSQQLLLHLEKIYEKMKKLNYSRERTVLFALCFIMEIMTTLVEMKIGQEHLPKSQKEIVEGVFSLESLDDTRMYLREVIIMASKAIMQELGDKERNLAANVKDYLEEHYCEEEISLAAVAEKLYANPSYLSRTFREKTGKTFSGYLFELRLDKAILLLRQTDLKAYEIAEKVGFKDAHYFSTCFKKYTGVSINEFRQQN